MGGCKTHRGVYANFTFAFVNTSDHGIEDDENRNEHGDEDVGYTAIADRIAGIVDIGAACFPGKDRETKAVNQLTTEGFNRLWLFDAYSDPFDKNLL